MLPRTVDRFEDCYFYHTMDVPGHGVVQGEWDLRAGIDDYIGRVEVAGKRVLEIGTASGYICFELERRGADVVAFDLGLDESWDLVSFAREGPAAAAEQARLRREHMQRIHNAFWYSHRARGSKAAAI